MTLVFRTRRRSLLSAILLSLTLLTSSVFASHVHIDGLAHYNDCQTCLQLSGLDVLAPQAESPSTLGIFRAISGIQGKSFTRTHTSTFQARAPPYLS